MDFFEGDIVVRKLNREGVKFVLVEKLAHIWPFESPSWLAVDKNSVKTKLHEAEIEQYYEEKEV